MRETAIALPAVLIAGSVLQAQEFRGTISGRVLDAQDAVAPNARFEHRNFRNVLMQLGLSRNALIPMEFPGGSILSRVFISLIRCHL
jgi:hypothetical protein